MWGKARWWAHIVNIFAYMCQVFDEFVPLKEKAVTALQRLNDVTTEYGFGIWIQRGQFKQMAWQAPNCSLERHGQRTKGCHQKDLNRDCRSQMPTQRKV